MKFGSLLLAATLAAPTLSAAPRDEVKAKAALQHYAENVYVVYSDAYTKALELQTAISAFVAAPSAKTQAAAKEAWLDSRTVWGQTEVFRFYEGPIDDAAYGVEGLINAWPLDEAYIDYVAGAPGAGIINNAKDFPVIDEEVLLGANENGSETNVATGFHAIEFLLWGQDLSATGPGERPFSDFVVGTGVNAERRATYLTAVTSLLVKHIEVVKTAWDPKNPASYGSNFAKQDATLTLTNVFKGMVSLLVDELAGERMYVGYESQSQEDEHSCFSDNTHVDIIENIQGVLNVWTGDYGTVTGTGIDEVLDAATAKKATKALTDALKAAKALPTPFDSLLIAPEDSEERKMLLDTILTIQDAGTAVKEAGETVGVTLPVQ
ncbi:MAG: iron-regulated protein [Proteobacteria bacterium]|nr:MAG: iron-regulated protein [Pseudomonadota bacterium]